MRVRSLALTSAVALSVYLAGQAAAEQPFAHVQLDRARYRLGETV